MTLLKVEYKLDGTWNKMGDDDKIMHLFIFILSFTLKMYEYDMSIYIVIEIR
jgi:hypothetical protein